MEEKSSRNESVSGVVIPASLPRPFSPAPSNPPTDTASPADNKGPNVPPQPPWASGVAMISFRCLRSLRSTLMKPQTAAVALVPLVTLCVSLAPAAGAASAADGATAVVGQCPSSVFVIGDSLTDASRGGAGKYVPRVFSRMGIHASVYGRNGLSTRGALNERFRAGFGSKQAKAAPVWIVALGTNDQARYGFGTNVRAVMRLANKLDKQVWWVNTSRPRGWQEGPGGPVNRILRKESKRYTNLRIINYRKLVKQQPRLLAGDRVHMTTRGSKWRARLYASPFHGCVPTS